MANLSRNQARKLKHKRIRNSIKGTSDRPRLNVFKSLTSFEAQLIDDSKNNTLAYVSTKGLKAKNQTEAVIEAGKMMGEKIITLGIKSLVFDRGGYIYHGKIKAFADSVRETVNSKGVKF